MTDLIYFQEREYGPEEAEYAFPPTVLAYLRARVPGDVKGEIREVRQVDALLNMCSYL